MVAIEHVTEHAVEYVPATSKVANIYKICYRKKKKSITCCILKSQMGKSQIYVYEIMKVSFKPLQLEYITFNYNSKLNRKTPLMPRNISVLCLAISF